MSKESVQFVELVRETANNLTPSPSPQAERVASDSGGVMADDPKLAKDIEIVRRAMELLAEVFTPVQLFWLAERMSLVHKRGWGEVRLTWRNGRPDELFFGPSERMSLLKAPEGEGE